MSKQDILEAFNQAQSTTDEDGYEWEDANEWLDSEDGQTEIDWILEDIWKVTFEENNQLILDNINWLAEQYNTELNFNTMEEWRKWSQEHCGEKFDEKVADMLDEWMHEMRDDLWEEAENV